MANKRSTRRNITASKTRPRQHLTTDKLLAALIILVVMALLAVVLNNRAVQSAQYLGLPTVPCINPDKPIVQNYDLTVRVVEDSQPVTLPATLGHDFGHCLHAIHTEDSSGRVHIESNYADQLTLGQLFDVWKVTFNDQQIGSHFTDATHILTVTVDGRTVATNLRAVPLTSGADIVVRYLKL